MISHNLEKVFAVADRIHVLRLGRSAGVFDTATTAKDAIAVAITGADAGGPLVIDMPRARASAVAGA